MAHKIVFMSSGSEFFTDILSKASNKARIGIINFPKFSVYVLETIIRYVYTGDLSIAIERVPELLRLSKLMKFDRVRQMCEHFLVNEAVLRNQLPTPPISNPVLQVTRSTLRETPYFNTSETNSSDTTKHLRISENLRNISSSLGTTNTGYRPFSDVVDKRLKARLKSISSSVNLNTVGHSSEEKERLNPKCLNDKLTDIIKRNEDLLSCFPVKNSVVKNVATVVYRDLPADHVTKQTNADENTHEMLKPQVETSNNQRNKNPSKDSITIDLTQSLNRRMKNQRKDSSSTNVGEFLHDHPNDYGDDEGNDNSSKIENDFSVDMGNNFSVQPIISVGNASRDDVGNACSVDVGNASSVNVGNLGREENNCVDKHLGLNGNTTVDPANDEGIPSNSNPLLENFSVATVKTEPHDHDTLNFEVYRSDDIENHDAFVSNYSSDDVSSNNCILELGSVNFTNKENPMKHESEDSKINEERRYPLYINNFVSNDPIGRLKCSKYSRRKRRRVLIENEDVLFIKRELENDDVDVDVEGLDEITDLDNGSLQQKCDDILTSDDLNIMSTEGCNVLSNENAFVVKRELDNNDRQVNIKSLGEHMGDNEITDQIVYSSEYLSNEGTKRVLGDIVFSQSIPNSINDMNSEHDSSTVYIVKKELMDNYEVWETKH